MPYLPTLNDQATVVDVMMMTPELARPILEYHETLLRGPSPLSVAQRELIAAYVSGVNACNFCHGAHTAVAETYGVEPGLLGSLLADPALAPAEPRLRPILHYVRKLTQAPSSVRPADVQAILDAGWDEQAVHHAAHVCALFNFMNRLVEGHGIAPMRPQDNAHMAQMLHDGGYRQF
ncbi:carboxymuconolactone decarboxylase family protein [Immundisolibacter sp.]